MSEKKRSKASLAMPFLVTAVMAPSVSTAQDPPRLKQPIRRNPPRPRPKPKPIPKPKIESIETDSGRITRRQNGTCWQSSSMKCPEGARCNPPPPRPVTCPPELSLGLPTQIKQGESTIWRLPNGQCEQMFNVKCPEGALCNPPPPQPVTCPDPLLPPHMRKQPEAPSNQKFAPPPPGTPSEQ
ncbi:MAG: hypothetical protein ACE366_03045 [Bradymonadia bacterium]